MLIYRLVEVTRRVIARVMSPWLHSNYEILEEVRVAKRDANAAKVAVTRLRSELRGEAFTPEVPEGTVRVGEGPQSRPVPAMAGTSETKYKAGQSMTKYLQGR